MISGFFKCKRSVKRDKVRYDSYTTYYLDLTVQSGFREDGIGGTSFCYQSITILAPIRIEYPNVQAFLIDWEVICV